MNKWIIGTIGFLVALGLDCIVSPGTGKNAAKDIAIQSLEVSPSTNVGVNDTVTVIMHVDPTTFDSFNELTLLWSLSTNQGVAAKVSESDSILVFIVPDQEATVTVSGTARITSLNSDTKTTAVQVLTLSAPEITASGVQDKRTYFQSDSAATLAVTASFQRPIDSLGVQLIETNPGNAVVWDTTVTASTLNRNIDFSNLLGGYLLRTWAASTQTDGQTLTGRDSLAFVVNAVDIMTKRQP